MTAPRAEHIAATLDLRNLPADFYTNPYPVYTALRETEPVKRMPDDSYLLTRHADLLAVYRDAPHQQFGVQRPATAQPGAPDDHGRAHAARD